jgi:hypothetical protein
MPMMDDLETSTLVSDPVSTPEDNDWEGHGIASTPLEPIPVPEPCGFTDDPDPEDDN